MSIQHRTQRRENPIRTDPESGEAATRTGFNTEFLDTPINLPDHRSDIAEDLVQINGSPIIDYTHFSLVLSRSRKFARWVGWNIDGTHLQLLSRTGINFTKDPRIPDQYQAGNDLYAENRLDRGIGPVIAMLIHQAVNDPLRGMTLLPRGTFIIVQPLFDEALELAQPRCRRAPGAHRSLRRVILNPEVFRNGVPTDPDPSGDFPARYTLDV